MNVLRVKRRVACVLLGVVLFFCSTFYFVADFGVDPDNSVEIKRPHIPVNVKKESAVFRDDVLGNYERTHVSVGNEPGAGGKAVHLEGADRQKADKTIAEYGVNMFVSDMVALDREVPDLRHPECKYWHYPSSLPTASVVIVFHDEGLSTIQRTAVSVLKKSPENLIEEIILVDDFSSKEDLKEKLESWVNSYNGKIRLIRNHRREGLIRTRTLGAQKSRGQVIIFLDAHCEVNTNWLPPLLTPISLNRTVMTVPIIDGINYDSLQYNPVYAKGKNFRGIFEWGMLYKEKDMPEYMARERKHESQPYKSPTHAGGLFAIDRDFFLELGSYDPGLLIWGGENYELSFKVWQCGGSLEWVPCSRVGHIYRGPRSWASSPVPVENRKGSFSVLANYRRVAEVWMDEYKEYFYTREPMASFYDMGDISAQLQLRKKLNCKSFKWFMENVAPDLLEDFPLLPKNVHWGQLQNPSSGLCLDTMHGATCGAWSCHGLGGNQMFRLNSKGQLGSGEHCLDADDKHVTVGRCQMGTVDGPWRYREDSKTLHHSGRDMCLEVRGDNKILKLSTCNEDTDHQKWEFQIIRPSVE